jgi:hypothetical protein
MSFAEGLRIAVVCLLGLMGAACTKPYDPPDISGFPQESDASFPGLRQLLTADPPLRVIWTHGMCTHDIAWAKSRADMVAKLLGFPEGSGTFTPNASGTFATYVVNVDGAELEIDFLVWSDLTQQYKDRLAFDAPDTEPGGQFPFDRAKLNGALKTGLMNDCLVDAVVYSGQNGEPIRQRMRQEVCVALGGSYGADGTCDTQSAPAMRLAIVTESLGSKLVFDAARALRDQLAAKGQPAELASFERQVGRTAAIYLVSNQIPLLDQANPVPAPAIAEAPMTAAEAAPDTSLQGFLELVRSGREAVQQESVMALPIIPIVAFTDPNDLLSYRLVPDSLSFADAQLINMIVSNDRTYFGYVEHPATAHCGYAYNSYVLGALVRGYRKGEALNRGDLPKPSSSCLSD